MRSALVPAAVVVLLCAAAPAAVADAGGQSALVDRYATLSGAMINAQAHSQNLSISDYLNATNATVYTLPATPSASSMALLASKDLTLMAGVPLHAATLPELNTQLANNGVSFTSSDYQSMSTLADAVLTKGSTADAQVTLAGAQWVSELSTLDTTQLQTPGTPTVKAPKIPKNALSFGLMVDKSVTALAADAPAIFSQVMASGITTPKQQAAWDKAMNSAWTTSNQELTSTLPDQCTGGMLAVMASGNTSSADGFAGCDDACRYGGMYLHNQTRYIFNPDTLNPVNTTLGSEWNAAQVASMPPAVRQAIADQSANPLASNPQALVSNAGTSCMTASTSGTQSLANTLPGIWGSLTIPSN